MFTLVIIIHFIVSFVMIIAVLLQAGKGAGIGSTFGGAGSQTLFGSAGPATFLGKLTGACAVIFMLTSLFLTFQSSKQRSASIMSRVPSVKVPAAPSDAQPSTPAQANPAANEPAKAPAKAPEQK